MTVTLSGGGGNVSLVVAVLIRLEALVFYGFINIQNLIYMWPIKANSSKSYGPKKMLKCVSKSCRCNPSQRLISQIFRHHFDPSLSQKGGSP